MNDRKAGKISNKGYKRIDWLRRIDNLSILLFFNRAEIFRPPPNEGPAVLTKEELKLAFAFFDDDKSGTITMEKLEKKLREVSYELSEKDLKVRKPSFSECLFAEGLTGILHHISQCFLRE